MTIRSKAKKIWGEITAKDVLNAPESKDGDQIKIIDINGQNYRAVPYTHKSDSALDDDLVCCDWVDATYICLDGKYQKDNVWLDCGTDKYHE